MSSLNSKDSRGSASDKELIEEFDRILVEKGVKFDNLVPVDWDIVEEFLRENLSLSPPLPMSPPPAIIPAPSQIPRCHEFSDIRMSSGNDKDSESSVSDKRLMEEFDLIFSNKDGLLENLDPTEWDIVEDILRQKVSPSPPLIVPAPPQITRCQENSDTCMNPRNDKDSESSVSIKTFLEEFNLTLKEDYENKVLTDWDNVEDVLMDKVIPTPPPSPPPYCPPLPSKVISAFPQFSIKTNTVVSQNRDQDNMVRPPPPIFTPQGHPPPPPVILAPSQSKDRRISVNHQDSTTSFSNKEFIEDVEWLPPKKKIHFVHMDSTYWNVTKECFREKVVLPPPPPPPLSHLSSPNGISANQDYMVGPPPPTFTPQTQSAPPPPVILAPSQSRVKRNSVNYQDSSRSFSNNELLEDVEWLPPEKKKKFGHMAPSDWNVTGEFFREKAVLPPPPSLTSCPPPGILAPSCFNVNTNIVVSQDGVQDNMFRPSPPRVILHAPPHVPPPPPHPVIPAPPGLNSNTIIGPPFLVAGGAHNQGQILHSLPIASLPKNVLLQPLTVVNGEVLYGVVPTPPPLNICISKKRKHEDDEEDDRQYVKKPPNAFMLFLKEQRPKVVAELNLKNSAAVNTIMGERWKSLPEEQKAKYFDQARVEKQLHEQQHPEWSNIANYGKKRKRVRRKTSESSSTAYTP